jgi:excisionase family DNA binding protein
MAKSTDTRTPLFVRLPERQAARLDRAAFELKASKQDIVSGLIARHLEDVGAEKVTVEPPDEGLTTGHAAFTPAPAPEVLTLAGLADLLQVDEAATRELAERGEVPGRKVGEEWRFSRDAVLRWLAGDA